MTRRRHTELEGPRGQSRPSGQPGDPRNRRADEQATEGMTFEPPLYRDQAGRVRFRPAADPGPPPTDGLSEDAAAWLQKLYSNLKTHGVIGGR